MLVLEVDQHKLTVIPLRRVFLGKGNNRLRGEKNGFRVYTEHRHIRIHPLTCSAVPVEPRRRLIRMWDFPESALLLRVCDEMKPDDVGGHIGNLVFVYARYEQSEVLQVL